MKVIKLSESELVRIVKRVVNESVPIIKDKSMMYQRLINDIGYFKVAQLMGGDKGINSVGRVTLNKFLKTDSPEDFLDKYENLRKSEGTGDWEDYTIYFDNNGTAIIGYFHPVYDEKKSKVRQWDSTFKDENEKPGVAMPSGFMDAIGQNFGLNTPQTDKLVLDWLSDTYDINVERIWRWDRKTFSPIVVNEANDAFDNAEHSKSFIRRIHNAKEDIMELIDLAKEEVDEDDFGDEFEYYDNIIYWVVQELQSRFGDNDDFWYDEEDEISEYIKDEFDDYLMG